jgi:hypothetical protein
MDIEKILALRLADPFRPFILILDNGRRLNIDKPYRLAVSPTKKFIVVPTTSETDVWFGPDLRRLVHS